LHKSKEFQQTAHLALIKHHLPRHCLQPISYSTVLAVPTINFNKSSAVAEMVDRGHNRHGPRRWGLLRPFRAEMGPRLIQCGLGRGLLPYQVASSSIEPFGHNKHGSKTGWWWVCPLFWGSWVPIEHKVAWPEAYRHNKCHLDPSSHLPTITRRPASADRTASRQFQGDSEAT